MSFKSFDEYHHSGVEWLGAIPSHWEVDRLKRRCRVIASNVDKKSRDGEADVMLCNYTDVYYNDVIDRSIDFMPATATAEQIDRFTLLAGDTIITKDSEEADDIAISAYVPESLQGVICGYHLSIIRPLSRADGAFVKRLFDSQYVRAKAEIQANGLTRVGLGLSAIQNLEMPWPPIDEQRRIAAFLDRETAKIDALAAEQKRLIELLEEKRRAVISHAVTKGLDSNAPTQASGVAWVGEVPSHWQVVKLGRIGACKGGAGFPDEYQGQVGLEIPFFKVADLTSAKLDGAMQDSAHTISRVTAKLLRAKVFPARTIVFAKVGAALLLQRYRWLAEPACIDNNMMGMSLHEGVEMRFLLYVLPLIDLSAIVNPGAVPSINEGQISSQQLPLPPLPEQEKIVAYIEYETERLDSLMREAERAIGLLRERRSSLISAAVTGQIDVRQLEVA